MKNNSKTKALSLPAVLLALGACVSQIERPPLAPELALPRSDHGALKTYDHRVADSLGASESAYWLLDRSDSSYTARLALTDQAVSTLDIQYFIWEWDATGGLLARRLIEAADRGVKIRLLLDDLAVNGAHHDIAKLDAHPAIEVRVFNPWRTRRSGFGKALEFFVRMGTLNHRMHFKTYLADGRFAIVGGRNISDRYFGLYEPFVQNDLDVLLAGPVVDDVAESFDLYWNGPLTYPIESVARPQPPLAETRAELDGLVSARGLLLQAFPVERADWRVYFEGLIRSAASGPAELYYDSPRVRVRLPTQLYEQLMKLVADARQEVLISAPYFIPDRRFIDEMQRLTRRGVRVALVTNSLATNNHTVAHTGYRRWRRATLSAGVELYELRADAVAREAYIAPPGAAPILGLHSKAVVVDERIAFIGTPNVDPRSLILNTELGVVTRSEPFAAQLGALLERDMAPENAWRVSLSDDGWLTWSSGDEVLKRQPARGFKQRVMEFFINLLPLKSQA